MINRKWVVISKEIHDVYHYVEAFDRNEAIQKVITQEPNPGDVELHTLPCADSYCNSLPEVFWDVRDDTNNYKDWDGWHPDNVNNTDE